MEVFISILCGIWTLLFISLLIWLDDKYEDAMVYFWILLLIIAFTALFALMRHSIIFW